MVSWGNRSDMRFAMAVLKASNMQEEGSVPGTCGREGRDEDIVPRRRTWMVMGKGNSLTRDGGLIISIINKNDNTRDSSCRAHLQSRGRVAFGSPTMRSSNVTVSKAQFPPVSVSSPPADPRGPHHSTTPHKTAPSPLASRRTATSQFSISHQPANALSLLHPQMTEETSGGACRLI